MEAQMSELLEKIKTPITTIPGIGNVIGATILGEVGDINRFSNGAKLVAYADIEMHLFLNLVNMNVPIII